MRAKLRVVLASKFTQMDRENVTLDTQIQQLGEEIRLQTKSVQQSEAEHSERTQRGYAIGNRDTAESRTSEPDCH